MRLPRFCAFCGADITHRRPDALTCSARCRVARARADKRPVKAVTHVTHQEPSVTAGFVERIHRESQEFTPEDVLRAIAHYQAQGDYKSRLLVSLLMEFQKFHQFEPPSDSIWWA